MRIIAIEVTQNDINEGMASQPYCCPIALAAARAFDVEFVAATYAGLRVGERKPFNVVIDTRPFVPLSRRAQEFMARFDRRKTVKPTTFRLQDPR